MVELFFVIFLKNGPKKYYDHFLSDHFKQAIRLIPKNRIYGNAMISRMFRDFPYRKRAWFFKFYKMISSLWEGLNVLVVEGSEVKFEIGNDLLIMLKRWDALYAQIQNPMHLWINIVSQ